MACFKVLRFVVRRMHVAGKKRVAVVGAGVSGLSVANSFVQDESVDVTVFAEHTSPNTTSDSSSAILFPNPFLDASSSSSSEGKSPRALKEKKWFTETFQHFCRVVSSGASQDGGVNMVSGYYLSMDDDSLENLLLKDLVCGFRSVPKWEREIQRLPPRPTVFLTTIAVDCRLYLPWLMKKFVSGGGRFVQKKISSLADLQRDHDVVVNCTGLASRELVQDASMYPVYGISVSLHAPWMKHFTLTTHFAANQYTLALPRTSDVLVGGVFHFRREPAEVDLDVTGDILSRVVKLVPSLGGADVLAVYPGLRPVRDEVRLEIEHTPRGPVIHNYGHGGNGVNYSWGCAQSVCELFRELN
jgi:glycine/D-amino acid oxidase-like deaminating enzyme